MKRVLLSVLTLLIAASTGWSQSAKPVKVIKPLKADVSPPLRDLAKPVTPYQPGMPPVEIPIGTPPKSLDDSGLRIPDPVVQNQQGPLAAIPTIQNFEGAGNTDNPFNLAPPDTDGDVGPNNYVQMINLIFTVYDKQGNVLLGPSLNSDLWAGFGGDCEFNNDGDPIVLYDELADRWVLSQFAQPAATGACQCIAVSTSGDPTGTYFRYAFPTPGNDYPKLGVWTDSYNMAMRNFSGAFNMDAIGFERDLMLVGDQNAQMVIFNMSAIHPGINNAPGLLPADIDGPAPPAGTNPVILGHEDAFDRYVMFEFDHDWNNTANSTLTLMPFVDVAPFDGNLCNFARNCIPQPGTTRRLDGFSDAQMHRLAFRDMGTHFAMVTTHAVDVGDFADHAGMRWSELRDSGGGWSEFQSGTYSPDSDHRWMGSIAMNAAGDIALGYSVSSSTTNPSIRFTGRNANDPLGQMTAMESVIIDGTGSQTGSDRWGDYSAMAVDPADGTTFWYTTEYYASTGSVPWQTRVASFQISAPNPTPPTITSTPNLNGTVGQPYAYDADNTVDVTGTAPITFSFTGPTGFSVDANTGVVTWTPTAGQVGANAVSITATNSEGSDTQNFTVTVVEPPPFAARINAGGADYTDTNGDLFEADQAYTAGSFGFVGGVTNTFGNAIGGTTDDVLYQSLRRPGTASSVTYRFDVPASGSYDVTLHMTAPGVGTGNFIMDVLAEGGLVFDDLDINTQSGGTYQALVVSFTASVTDGTLDLDFVTVNRQALIGAIAVEESSGPPTPQDISVSPLALDFGQVETGQTADLVTTITNDGGTVLNVTGLTLSGGDFSLVSPPGTPFQVAANGGSVALTVRFGPGSTGAQSETLDIDSDDPDEATVTVTLDGEGTDPPAGEEFRINAGGADYTDTNGDLFEADQAYTAGSFGFVGGTSSSFPNPIGGTTDDLLYQSLRRSGESSSFSYQFDVSSSATFDVTLYLTAPAIGPGSFVLDVVAEGATVLNDLDVNAASGGTYQALTQTFSVSVTDGTLNLDFVDVNKQAIVSAIAVVEQTAAPELAKRGTQAADTPAGLPEVFTLYQNHPNPFNPETRIRFDLPENMHVSLRIFNMLGEEVRTLVDGVRGAGAYDVRWDARDNNGNRVTSGMYIYRLQGDGHVQIRKMILMR